MYLKHKQTGEHFCYSAGLEATGKYEKVASLPAAPAPEAPVAKPAPKPRAPKGK